MSPLSAAAATVALVLLISAAVAANDEIASLQLRSIRAPLHTMSGSRSPIVNFFEARRQLRNGKYMRFGRADEVADDAKNAGDGSSSSTNQAQLDVAGDVLFSEPRPQVGQTQDQFIGEDIKRRGSDEDVQEFMRFGRKAGADESDANHHSFNTMMRFGKRADVERLQQQQRLPSNDDQLPSKELEHEKPLNHEAEDAVMKRSRPPSESGSQFMRFGK